LKFTQTAIQTNANGGTGFDFGKFEVEAEIIKTGRSMKY
jgi:hypothetical protein